MYVITDIYVRIYSHTVRALVCVWTGRGGSVHI